MLNIFIFHKARNQIEGFVKARFELCSKLYVFQVTCKFITVILHGMRTL